MECSSGAGNDAPGNQFGRISCKRERRDLVGSYGDPKSAGALLGRHFEEVIIILWVRWYLRYSLSYRDLEEMMAERGLDGPTQRAAGVPHDSG